MKLKNIAYARSGDKGEDVNIGLIARSQKEYDLIAEKVTEEKVFAHFSSLNGAKVIRYELPNLWALNFVLKQVIKGGASRCLRIDSQGKALGQALLEMEI